MGAKKILIIDYDQSSLSTLQGILAKQGYQIVTAADGQAGWDKYNKESPDLVLMEAMLPKVHGFELCQRITSERNSQATVFIMTGVYKDRVYRTEALRTYGASEYFEKPLKMAELLTSIEAVLGKPEPRPAETQPAAAPAPPRPSREIRAEMSPAEPRKREKPKTDDDIFSLPADLDKLSRDLPKPHKPALAHRQTPAEDRLDAFADELLKKVIVESTAPKPVEPKPAGGNGNGNGNGKAEIDQFLKSALAGLDLDKEKVKVPKTAPLPPPPLKARPVPTPPLPAAPEPKPTPPPARRAETFFPPADMKNTLVPGDPGSDVSPFFTPVKPKPEAPVEKPRTQAAPAQPAHVPPPKTSSPAEKDERPAATAYAQVRPAPARPEPSRHEPVHHETKSREAEAIASADIFRDLSEPKEKKGFPKLVVVALVIVALAAAGFVLLRPKPKAPDLQSQQAASQAVTETNTPAEPVNEVPPPEVKPAPVKQKAQPQPRPADPGPAGADAILPTGTSAALPPIGTKSGAGTADGRTASGLNTAPVNPAATKTESAPPLVTETAADPSQGAAADPGTASNTVVVPPPDLSPAAAPVKEGDLVDLGSVTEPPKIIKSADPVYPQTAQRLGIGGSITVNALIDEKGNVIDTGILKGIQDDKGLGRAAVTAVKKWKFQPARKNGVAVKVWKSFIIAFKAEANPADMME
jgi:TonB family protein